MSTPSRRVQLRLPVNLLRILLRPTPIRSSHEHRLRPLTRLAAALTLDKLATQPNGRLCTFFTTWLTLLLGFHATMSSALQGWHPGELALQMKLGFAGPMTYVWSMVEDELREQHQVFHTTRLPFIPLTTLDSDGRPWACMLAGDQGRPGFVTSPNVQALRVRAHSWDGDPLVENVAAWQNASHSERFLVAGLGIELPTRRRNKFAGSLNPVKTKKTGEYEYDLYLDVNQALGYVGASFCRTSVAGN